MFQVYVPIKEASREMTCFRLCIILMSYKSLQVAQVATCSAGSNITAVIHLAPYIKVFLDFAPWQQGAFETCKTLKELTTTLTDMTS